MPYALSAELTAYATSRGYVLVKDPDVLLTLANDWLETLSFKGYPVGATAFPRSELIVNSVLVPDDVIPDAIKKAEMQMAIEIDKGNDPFQAVTRDNLVIREKVDVIEVQYSDRSSAPQTTIIRSVMPLLKNYLVSAGGLEVVAAN
jgi:hypothetical protein